jgi:ABC-type branched-subunit amino acid transport system substrate-binding protein
VNNRKRTTALAGTVAAALLLAAGCGSSGSGSSAAATTAPVKQKATITIGVLTDVTGVLAASDKTTVDGVKAGTYYAARDGYTIKYVVADTATNPTTTLAAAQKLVTQDNVTAVVAVSALTFLAAPYLTAHHIPVVGICEDGPEWTTSNNMFSVSGELQTTKVSTTYGKFFKLMGVTNLASIGYNASPVSSEAAESTAASAQAAGIKVGYLNARFPYGQADVGPEVLAMKAAGVDGLNPTTTSDTAFALLKGLKEQGVTINAAMLATGYGAELLNAGPGAIQNAQGVYFMIGFEPVEMQTPATKQFQTDLQAAGISGEPTYAEYNGYTSIGMLVQALDSISGTPTRASVLTALQGIHKFTAMGLYGTHSVDPNDRVNVITGADNCSWMTKFEGTTFKLVPGADPICGTPLAGVTVAPAS